MAQRPGETDDLALLSRLDESILLNELKARYKNDGIYTYVGDILVAVNPFKKLTIYEKKQMAKYKNTSRKQNPPHIYAISDAAYYQMVNDRKHQCCVISGESGAGKTESCKFMIAQLVELSQAKTNLEQSIIKVNPLLEAFGNAQTLMNDNSSRFGKYIQLKFRDGRVVGAKINEYLLEKSRVVFQNPGEQNFHIFYCLFAGLSQDTKSKLMLGDPSKYDYLCEGAAILKRNEKAKKEQFEELENAMDLVGFEVDNQENLFICLAAVLHMGNIQFGEDDNEYSFVKNKADALATTAGLMGIDPSLMADILTISVSVARGETIKRHLNQNKAAASRDAIAKSLYDRLFRWIVNRVNQLLAPSAEDMAVALEIGILDIFGFEKFDTNSFEQLCINLANEQLQFFFNQHIFMLEQQEYKSEGIDVSNITFKDNKQMLDFFLNKPIGVLALIDEECSFPKATDTTFVQKMHKNFEKLPFYTKPKNTITDIFTIDHYAGMVEYDCDGFLEKNRDSLPSGANELMQASKNPLIELIFKGTLTRTGTLALGSISSRRTGRLKKKPLKMGASVGGAKMLTVGAQFKNSLQVLIEKMNQAHPHFVRCIKPNHRKAPNDFDDKYVTAQLSYTGMLETTRIRKEGFAIRPTFEEFVERYKTLAAQVKMASNAASCRKILTAAKLDGYQVGKTKVFLKYWHVDKLIELLEVVHKAATRIQTMVRGFLCRRRFKKLIAQLRKEAEEVARFTRPIPGTIDPLYRRLKAMNTADASRPKEVIAKLKTPSPEPPPKPEPTTVTSKLDPPSDLHKPPQAVKMEELSDDDDEMADEDGDIFVAAPGRFNKFGKEGTKQASVRWFKATQSDAVLTQSGSVQVWFHGVITRRQAEQRLTDKPNGSFLIRISESQFGYSLSFRVTGRCKHYLIKQVNSGKYIIVGEARVHRSLEDLVMYYQKNPINTDGDLLTLPCAAEGHSGGEGFDTLMTGRQPKQNEPPQLPPRMLSMAHGPRSPPPVGQVGQLGRLGPSVGDGSPSMGRQKVSTTRGNKRGLPTLPPDAGPALPPRNRK